MLVTEPYVIPCARPPRHNASRPGDRTSRLPTPASRDSRKNSSYDELTSCTPASTRAPSIVSVRIRPPARAPRSYNVTRTPALTSVSAPPSPAAPAPITATFRITSSETPELRCSGAKRRGPKHNAGTSPMPVRKKDRYAAGLRPYGSSGSGRTLPPQMNALITGRGVGPNVPCITIPGGSSAAASFRISFCSIIPSTCSCTAHFAVAGCRARRVPDRSYYVKYVPTATYAFSPRPAAAPVSPAVDGCACRFDTCAATGGTQAG